MHVRRALASLTLLGLPALLSAGPCFDCGGTAGFEFPWTNDRRLSAAGGGPVGRPDVAVPGFAPDRLFAVWSADRGAGTGFDVYLARSTDAGCSWKIEVIAGDPADEIEPAIAVSDTGMCLTVVFNRVASAGRGSIRALRSTDGGLTFQPQDTLSRDTEGNAHQPDVAVTPGQGAPHFHVVWRARVAVGVSSFERVFYKRNLMACGSNSMWVGSGARTNIRETNLSAGVTPLCDLDTANAFAPRVAADTRSNAPFVDSAASVVFEVECAGGRHVMFTRTNSSGDDFFGRESSPQLIPPFKIDEAPGNALGETQIDSSDAGFGGGGIWNGVLWPDNRSGAGRIMLDAQNVDGPMINSDWNRADVQASLVANPNATTTALSAYEEFGPVASVAKFVGYWTAPDPSSGASDIWFRPGDYVFGAVPNILLTCPTALPARLTGIQPDERSTLPGSEARQPAVDEAAQSGDQFLVWVDTRNDANGEIFFKRTDRVAPPAVTGLVASSRICPDNDIDVAWAAPSACDVKVYHVMATGPTTVRVDVYPPATQAQLPIDDATGSGTYTISVVVEDEACNQSAPAQITGVTTPRCPAFAPGTPVLGVECNGGPDNDGEPDPGETVLLTLPVSNTGNAAATGVQGSLRVTAPATGVTVVDGLQAYPDIAAGGSQSNPAPFRLRLSSTLPCGRVDLALDVTSSETPGTIAYSFDVGMSSCDLNACTATCDVTGIASIARLKGVKRNASDLELSWAADAQSGDGYNVWYILNDKTKIPACSGCPSSLPVAGCQPTGALSATTCPHPGVVMGPANERFYYNVRGVCNGTESAR